MKVWCRKEEMNRSKSWERPFKCSGCAMQLAKMPICKGAYILNEQVIIKESWKLPHLTLFFSTSLQSLCFWSFIA